MTPQDRSLKHHDIYRKRIRTWRKMKMFFRVETGGERLGRRMSFLLSSVGFQLWVAQRLPSWWFDSLSGWMMTSLPVWELLWPTEHARANCCQYILHMCSGQSFVSCPRILPFTSFRETDFISQPTDLDIITSEREITLVEQLALLAICCTSAHFMAVCGPEI